MSKNIGLYKIRRYKVLENGRKEETYPTIQGKMNCTYKFWSEFVANERAMRPQISHTELYMIPRVTRVKIITRAVTKYLNGNVIERELLSVDGKEIKGVGNEKKIGI